jgi:pimeloyl-ACP methyl ester carboxylesterase
MKTKIFMALAVSVFFTIIAQAQSDSVQRATIIQDSVTIQLIKHNLQLINTSGIAECNTPPNTVVFGKKTDGGLPDVPPDVDGPGTYTPPVEGDKNIYWIHGLNGSVESWRVAAQATEFGSTDGSFVARKAHSVIGLTGGDQTYLESNGIAFAARDMKTVADYLPPAYPHTAQDYIIAHSQGGIVAREWLRDIDENPSQYPNYVHGLVTFGTSHGGAMILNKTRPDLENRAPAFFKEACSMLGKAEVEKSVKDKLFLRMVLSQELKDRLVGLSCDFFSETVVPFALDNYHKPTTLDYYVGAPFLTKPSALHPTGLSNYILKVPVVQFYGEEEQPVMWRFFSSMLDLGKDQVLQAGNASGEFAYDKDDQLQQKAGKLIDEFTALKHYEDDVWGRLFSLSCLKKSVKKYYYVPVAAGVTFTLCLAQKAVALAKSKKTSDAYKGAITWLYNANNYYLTDIVGAKVTTSVKYCIIDDATRCMDVRTIPPTVSISGTRTEVLAGSGSCINGPILLGTYFLNSYTTCTHVKTGATIYKNQSTYKANDGVVMVESATTPLKMPTGVSHKYQLMVKTNHDQMKNSTRTKDALNTLYDGNLGQFFKVDPR